MNILTAQNRSAPICRLGQAFVVIGTKTKDISEHQHQTRATENQILKDLRQSMLNSVKLTIRRGRAIHIWAGHVGPSFSKKGRERPQNQAKEEIFVSEKTKNHRQKREKVKIPYDKPYIILKGEGKRRTLIVWGDHYSTSQSPTFMSLADNVIVRSISFVNTYNFLHFYNRMAPAVAAMISGDKSAFYRCNFVGVQDTLWDDQGRHYFKACTIQGAVDFIFGSGQSIYEGCTIKVLGGGFITAQGRDSPNDSNGFVFKGCNIFGTGLTYLGRPWRGYSRVIFFKCYFANVIQPTGWNSWNYVGQENQITYAEYGCYGPGADSRQRVNWMKKLSLQAINELTSMSFINSENWIQRQPI
ncbi:probable pectinesterase 29 [Hevea brasiliensis]|uniref:probable pectinesterase 29 n=1 Tax=Hevea brasiliensis TaxID=3981 RepID=UPI0025D5A428|nr:probable pectinesterase 29 [Hevea brasiliensis]